MESSLLKHASLTSHDWLHNDSSFANSIRRLAAPALCEGCCFVSLVGWLPKRFREGSDLLLILKPVIYFLMLY